MNRIDNFGTYQQNYYESSVQNRNGVKKTGQATGADKTQTVELSRQAQDLLKELKSKYGNMDFMVAEYETDEEAAEYLSRGTKEYSVLMDPETLEEMAKDKDTKEKYLGLLDEATGKLSELKEELEDDEDGKEVTHIGVSIGKDGTLTYFAELEQMSEKQRERIEASKEKKQEEAKKADKAKQEELEKPKPKRTQVKAGSIEELLEKIRSVDWDEVPATRETRGGRFDQSI